jgi:hypothetical protein
MWSLRSVAFFYPRTYSTSNNLEIEERILRELFSNIMLTDSIVYYPQLPPGTQQGMIRYGYIDIYRVGVYSNIENSIRSCKELIVLI